MSAKNRFLHFQGAGRREQGATATVTATATATAIATAPPPLAVAVAVAVAGWGIWPPWDSGRNSRISNGLAYNR